MNILKKYAAQHGFNYSEIIKDFMDAPENEQVEFLKQIGGSSNEDQLMNLINSYAQAAQVDPQEIIQYIQSLDEPEAQSFIEKMQSELSGNVEQTGGIPVTEKGYYELDPEENPYAIIPSGDITMEGLDYPINAYDGNTGEYLEQMQPGKNYKFNTDKILEEPVIAQTGLNYIKETLESAKKNKTKFSNRKEEENFKLYLEALESAEKTLTPIIKAISSSKYEDEKQKLIKRAEVILNNAQKFKPGNVIRKERYNPNYYLTSTPPQYEYTVDKNVVVSQPPKVNTLSKEPKILTKDVIKSKIPVNNVKQSSKIPHKVKLNSVNKPEEPVVLSPEDKKYADDIYQAEKASRQKIENSNLNLGDNQLPISNKIKNSLIERLPKLEDDNEENVDINNSKPFEFSRNNGLRNMLLGNNVAKAFQPTAPIFKRHIDLQAPETPELDATPYIDEIGNQYQMALKNINPNSAVGMSFLSSLHANSLDNIRKVVNDVSARNNQIRAKNIFSRISTALQEQNTNQAYDYEAYNTFLQDEATRDALKTNAFNSILKAQNEDKQLNTLLDLIPMLYPGIEESEGSFWDKIKGTKKYKINSKPFELNEIN